MLLQNLVLFLAAGLSAALPSQNSIAVRDERTSLAERATHHGIATIYFQGGRPGSCRQTNPDSAMIVALSYILQKNESPGPYCGRKVRIRNTGSDDVNVKGKGNLIFATVADTCPSCDVDHLDLSLAAWNALTDNSPYSVAKIDWVFV
ncbi:uncharacterized protein E0L32_005924 [Thyridium curvatum]|uniref:RlpA-like protein double-psi beta-barrel domain-containing protein n=1 Tax=Thyridium curvatum TaxID=1093900 RepID=A0A507B9I5_9PEZI|nr:uncharacterized protein E0L32_005924 [Thyridium curvatum]TPX13721.1 hypothetical protein E0L32_005924 [Thyridium curvatum]